MAVLARKCPYSAETKNVTRVAREMGDPFYCLSRREILLCAMLVLANIKMVFVTCYCLCYRPKKKDDLVV